MGTHLAQTMMPKLAQSVIPGSRNTEHAPRWFHSHCIQMSPRYSFATE